MISLLNRGERRLGLLDFLTRGAGVGLRPHPLFDTEYYFTQRPDVRASGVNPLIHYITTGAKEGANPHLLFDTAWYFAQYPELTEGNLSPLEHYLVRGAAENADPHPLFSSAYYLEHAPDVARAALNPLLHFVDSGFREGRRVSPFFDADYYRRIYADAGDSHLPAICHYLTIGAAEDRLTSIVHEHAKHVVPNLTGPGSAIALARRDRSSYYATLRNATRLSLADRQRWRQRIEGFSDQPTVSLLIHVPAGSAVDARATLESIARQIYPRWEICLAVDPGSDLDIRELDGERVKIVARGRSGGDAIALNTGLDIATGEFVGVVATGDTLHALALAQLVEKLQDTPNAALIYSDEDILDEYRTHREPTFKPDWSPELLLATDYILRLGLFRTEKLRDIGGFRPGPDRSHAHDMALRFTDKHRDGIAHVQNVLYHRRKASDASGSRRAVEDFLTTRKIGFSIAPGTRPGFNRVQLLPATKPLISVVIPTGNATFDGPNGREWLVSNCVESLIAENNYKNIEIVVVHDGNLESRQIERFRQIGINLVEDPGPTFNFSRKINLGVRASLGSYIVILNDDTKAKRPDWIAGLLGFAELPSVGVVGAKLFFPNGRLQHTGVIVQNGYPGHIYYGAAGGDPGQDDMNIVARNCLAVTGACQMFRRAMFDELGGYDEGLPLNYNDVDFCVRAIESGRRVVFSPFAELYHFEGISKIYTIGDRRVSETETTNFLARWLERYPTDPYYNLNLPQYQPVGFSMEEPQSPVAGHALSGY